ncbi:hypothetical protein SAMN02910340_01691 [Methanosarcina thermophila]|jgi:uncharacterized membrane protein|nr:hypothetical protein [Methanosarcina thermophila]ALK06064.1 MAG: hypothetical protein AAY43_10650 [Methanosarcina sp. 795]AKB12342.1 hypothetical protein MSTHT_0584 [Methanosarcina thermophila TM-1]AKB14454.1 hypothetical protein MSTHC_0136 [Methanosarcina thermophila CHTI-55]NLU57036.1 hypothetical protein [Methanosarcina thermophila]SFT66598.1 hypothetical protein SAMN02910340_01691 [Methanosarcina thermophila]
MNLRLFIVCIAAVLALVGPVLADSTATIHGAVYGWDTFEPLENAVVEVNSTPSQSMVARYGMYSFDLMPGDYTIKARYYQNSTLIYSAEESVEIKDDGTYVRDLLLLPIYSDELMDSSGVDGSSKGLNNGAVNSSSNDISPVTEIATGQTGSGKDNSGNIDPARGAGSLSINYLLTALLLFFLLITGYRFARKGKKIEENKPDEGEYIPRKRHTTKNLSEHAKVELTAKAPAKRTEFSHKSVNGGIEAAPEDLELGISQDFQAQESNVKPSEKISATESVADPVIEPMSDPVIQSPKEPLKKPVKELEKEPVREPVKSPLKKLLPEIPEKKVTAEQTEVKVESRVNETEPIRSEPQGEKQAISSEKTGDKPSVISENETSAPRKKHSLPADLQEVMDIIRSQGGRITQKDLRSRLKYSEGKVSLMLADLERRELIEKFKRGRGNIVILKDEER